MPISSRLANDFHGKTRKKGAAYAKSGAVTFGSGDDTRVTALVEGTDTYHVTIELDGDNLFAWCTCPYVNQNYEPCKHIWATLLAADQKNYLAAAAMRRRL